MVFLVNAQRDCRGDEVAAWNSHKVRFSFSTGLPHGLRNAASVVTVVMPHRNGAQDVARTRQLITRTDSASIPVGGLPTPTMRTSRVTAVSVPLVRWASQENVVESVKSGNVRRRFSNEFRRHPLKNMPTACMNTTPARAEGAGTALQLNIVSLWQGVSRGLDLFARGAESRAGIVGRPPPRSSQGRCSLDRVPLGEGSLRKLPSGAVRPVVVGGHDGGEPAPGSGAFTRVRRGGAVVRGLGAL